MRPEKSRKCATARARKFKALHNAG
jgi:hypothetical protein